jgi:hypothetical protein
VTGVLIQARMALEGVLARELPAVLAALHVPSLRSAVEVALRQLVATFYLRYAVPSLKARASHHLTGFARLWFKGTSLGSLVAFKGHVAHYIRGRLWTPNIFQI